MPFILVTLMQWTQIVSYAIKRKKGSKEDRKEGKEGGKKETKKGKKAKRHF